MPPPLASCLSFPRLVMRVALASMAIWPQLPWTAAVRSSCGKMGSPMRPHLRTERLLRCLSSKAIFDHRAASDTNVHHTSASDRSWVHCAMLSSPAFVRPCTIESSRRSRVARIGVPKSAATPASPILDDPNASSRSGGLAAWRAVARFTQDASSMRRPFTFNATSDEPKSLSRTKSEPKPEHPLKSRNLSAGRNLSVVPTPRSVTPPSCENVTAVNEANELNEK
mmetsp:Transcript_23991/g.64905  ORF Transcript_23991/g.64905 Transcript_23991/m.64905 type:complete len:225 (+) Transcript_23991:380-1054(+)